MEELPGALGTSASLAFRLGQAIFAVASLLFMCLDLEFYSYTAFCFLVTIMGLVIPWSLILAVVDVFSVFIKRPSRQRGILTIIIIGDWTLSFLLLAASCSTASVTSLLLDSKEFCEGKLCMRYQLSSAMAFLLVSFVVFFSLQSLASPDRVVRRCAVPIVPKKVLLKALRLVMVLFFLLYRECEVA